MIAKYCVDRLARKLFQNAGALPCFFMRTAIWGSIAGDKVSGQKHCIRLLFVDALDHLAEKERLRKMIHVNVAQLRNTHAIEIGRQAPQGHVTMRYIDPVALNFSGIERDPGGTKDARFQEIASTSRSASLQGKTKPYLTSILACGQYSQDEVGINSFE